MIGYVTHNQEENQSKCDSVTMHVCNPVTAPFILVQCSVKFHESLATLEETSAKEGEPQLVEDCLNSDRYIAVDFNA